MNPKAFTLIELIIYVAITAAVLVSTMIFAWGLIVTDANTRGKQETYSNARTVMNQFTLKIQGAEDVKTGDSTFETHPGALTLDYPGGDTDVIFNTYTTIVDIGGESVTIRKLRMKDGPNNYMDLTSDNVDVTSFVITDLTRGSEPDNLLIQLTIEKANPGEDPNYDASISVETAISLRQ